MNIFLALYKLVKFRRHRHRLCKLRIEKLDKRFENLKKIQNVFLNCYYNKLNY